MGNCVTFCSVTRGQETDSVCVSTVTAVTYLSHVCGGSVANHHCHDPVTPLVNLCSGKPRPQGLEAPPLLALATLASLCVAFQHLKRAGRRRSNLLPPHVFQPVWLSGEIIRNWQSCCLKVLIPGTTRRAISGPLSISGVFGWALRAVLRELPTLLMVRLHLRAFFCAACLNIAV